MDEHLCSGYEEDYALVFLEAALELFLEEGVDLHKSGLIIIKRLSLERYYQCLRTFLRRIFRNIDDFALSRKGIFIKKPKIWSAIRTLEKVIYLKNNPIKYNFYLSKSPKNSPTLS